jgi:hypothetical protein
MSPAVSRTPRRIASHPARASARCTPRAKLGPGASPALARKRDTARHSRTLGRYTDLDGRAREIVARPGAGGSVLVLEQGALGRGERRLLAHLAPDEPSGNSAVVCRRFLSQARRERCRCRPLAPEDLSAIPFASEVEIEPSAADDCAPPDVPQLDGFGRAFRLECFPTGMSIPELRWGCRESEGAQECLPVSLRDAIASLESYEPVRTLTARALAFHEHASEVSITVLRAELRRVRESPIVLNRGLRKTVLDAVEHRGQSMSEIAMRCGRIKRDAAGNESGETSWLARRLGLLPEGGRKRVTPWIHSDVLALIARDGLGASPREVEVD